MIAVCQVPFLQSALAGCLQRITGTVFQVIALLFSKEMEAMTKPVRSLYTQLKPYRNTYTSTGNILEDRPQRSLTTRIILNCI